jgi:hypothetical protein
MPRQAQHERIWANPQTSGTDRTEALPSPSLGLVLGFLLLQACSAAARPQPASVLDINGNAQSCAPLGSSYTRTTIYFGLNRPMGKITETEWETFLRDEVTPRFPDGLTILEADGQYRGEDGSIEHERSKVLVLLHDDKPSTQKALNELVVRYKQSFSQQSVLWETARVCAAF